jgi:predicted MFS family arabinose efflux permease
VELRSDSPLVPLRLLRIRSLRAGLIIAAAWMSSFGMQLYFLTIFLQEVLDEGPMRAGLSFLPLAISVVVGTQIGGRLVGRIGIARTLAAGMSFGAIGLLLYLRLPADGSLADLIPGMIIAGLGQGVAFTTMYVAASTGVPEGNEGVASAMAMTAQQLGGSVGLALLAALLTERVTALGGTTVGVQHPTRQRRDLRVARRLRGARDHRDHRGCDGAVRHRARVARKASRGRA